MNQLNDEGMNEGVPSGLRLRLIIGSSGEMDLSDRDDEEDGITQCITDGRQSIPVVPNSSVPDHILQPTHLLQKGTLLQRHTNK